MAELNRRILFAGLAAFLGGCSGVYFEQPLSSTSTTTSFTNTATPIAVASEVASSDEAVRPAPRGHIYLLRGLIGDIFSTGMDSLATEMNRRGVRATTHGVFAWAWVADEAARKYRADSAPIVLIGHSTGGDNAIAMARRLGDAKVPVAMIITFDPTPIADPIPPNVNYALNIYQSTNPIGGGQIKPASEFRGHLANINLREHREIIHITMDKSKTLHELVAAKILEVISADNREAAGPRVAGAVVNPAAVSEPPIPIKYTIPGAEPIAIWDSGMPIMVAATDSLETIARSHGVPVWAIAQVNNLNRAEGIQAGQRVVVPRNTSVPRPALAEATPAPTPARRKSAATRDAHTKPATIRQISQAGGN